MVTGPLIHLHRLHLRGLGGPASLPKPINVLPVCQPPARFGLLPAVDTWNVVGAAEGGKEGGGEEGGGGEEDGWAGAKEEKGGSDMQAQLSQLGSKFGSWAAKGWAGLG